MAVRKFKPTTPGQRHKIIGTFEEITASVPEKSLVIRIVQLVLHCCFTLMVKNDTLLLLMDCKWAAQ